MPASAGNPLGQDDLDSVEEIAPVRAQGKIFMMGTIPAWTFYKVTDIEIESISDNGHVIQSLYFFVHNTIATCGLQGQKSGSGKACRATNAAGKGP